MSRFYNSDVKPDTPDTGRSRVEQDWQERLCKLGEEEWLRGRQYVDELNDVYEEVYQMLRGTRPTKNYDWQSNVVVPKVFQVVWTAIPYLVQKIFGATPIIGVKSYEKKGAWQREEILEFWRTMQAPSKAKHTNYYWLAVMWILRALLNGVGIIKKTWHQQLKHRSMTVSIPMALDNDGNITKFKDWEHTWSEPVEDWPYNIVVNNKDIVVDWALSPGQSMCQGRFVTHRIMTDLDAMYDSRIAYKNLDDIKRTQNSTNATYHQDRANITTLDQQSEPPDSDVYTDVELYERTGLFPVYKKQRKGDFPWRPCLDKEAIGNDDVVVKHMIMSWSKGESLVLHRFEPSPYNEINYVDMHIYPDAERWQAMGMVEPFKDLYTAINDNLNAMFDEINQNLMPPVMMDNYAMWEWDTVQYAPGQKWLVGANRPIRDVVHFKEPSNITRDAWQKHMLIDNEIQLTSAVTPPMQGVGKEKAATTNVLNAQMSAGKLDFIIKMIEKTGLVPDAQMDVRFAKMFAHPKTFEAILGEPFEYRDWEELYKYIPAASSVKLEHQKEQEIMQDMQLIQAIGPLQNPGVPKIINILIQNILRNRNMPLETKLLDEDFYEPSSEAGNMTMLNRMTGAKSNQNDVAMSQEERGVRRLTHEPRR